MAKTSGPRCFWANQNADTLIPDSVSDFHQISEISISYSAVTPLPPPAPPQNKLFQLSKDMSRLTKIWHRVGTESGPCVARSKRTVLETWSWSCRFTCGVGWGAAVMS